MSSQTLDLNDPIAVLLAVCRAFSRADIEAAAYGGLALAVYGEPRETKDADLAVAGIGGAQAEAALHAAGLDVRVAFDRVRFGGAVVSRITLLGGSALNTADLVEPRSPRYAREAIARAVTGEMRGEGLRVVSPEDFVVFKVLATRELDVEDAAQVLRALGSQIDIDLIDREIELLAQEIPDHDVLGRWRAARR